MFPRLRAGALPVRLKKGDADSCGHPCLAVADAGGSSRPVRPMTKSGPEGVWRQSAEMIWLVKKDIYPGAHATGWFTTKKTLLEGNNLRQGKRKNNSFNQLQFSNFLVRRQ